jgi:hypothetical protein
MLTVYVSIGNSDDKLTQAEWSKYVAEFFTHVAYHSAQIHGEWYSSPAAPFQNACMCFEITDRNAALLRECLQDLRTVFNQGSVAWATARTEFI